jgi:2,4-dienoyl-CoA reductase-like NADH-dependent reductase (Old Yellow Enzyme family)/thioredoxin reductase
MTEFSSIFTPLKIGRMTVKNRIEVAPAMPMLASIDGDITPELIEWERALARGGAGIVTIGDTPVSNELAMNIGHVLNLGIDKSMNTLNRLAETIQRYGAKASIELTYFNPYLKFSPSTLSAGEIKILIESYAKAAYRCLNAGLDMILIHGAHGHLLSQFLSPLKNTRIDAYGGSFGNRARYAADILDAIREKVGDRLAIEYRISADELFPGGLTLDDQLEFARLIQDKIDLIHISVGNLFVPESTPFMIQPTYIARGINVHYAERFKKELKIPVTALGSITLEMAEQIIAQGQADMVAMARGLIADPDSVNKARKGRTDKIRPCVRCNSCIDRSHREAFLAVHCAVNPLAGREAEFKDQPLPEKKKVVIIGGGPAGMEAAGRSAGLGHEVVLFEKKPFLGGTLNMAAAPPFKADMRKYLDWAVRTTLENPRIRVRLSTEAAPEKIQPENPDVLIIAVGSRPIIPAVQGIERKNVVWAGDVVLNQAETGARVVVAGAGLTGSETALYLAQQGRQVTLIDALDSETIQAGVPFATIRTLWGMLGKLKVEIKTEVTLTAVSDNGVTIQDSDRKCIEIPCDTLVLALGSAPQEEMVRKFRDLAPEVRLIGDCNNEKGNLYKAVTEGFFAAMDT